MKVLISKKILNFKDIQSLFKTKIAHLNFLFQLNLLHVSNMVCASSDKFKYSSSTCQQ